MNVRAYAASQAIPISNLKVVVSTNIDNSKVIFFNGVTNASGVIEGITLPAPKLDNNNLDFPRSTSYDIEATINNTVKKYNIKVYENLLVVQNINIVPKNGDM